MKLINADLLEEKMKERKDKLNDQLTRDFGSGEGGRLHEHREVKYWYERILRGEFYIEDDEK
ncbi:hypothetical protein P4571_08270 [Niallia alba]|uniref:hypothetical protein n=1 Tax=Niallia alba TaxID=2729105 RepID=UPI002E1CB3F8|nr:hypothetical protein [Niallia alba]